MLFNCFFLSDDRLEMWVAPLLAEPISKWQSSEQGQWVMNHARNLRYTWYPDQSLMGYQVRVIGDLSDGPLVEYLLRWPKQYW